MTLKYLLLMFLLSVYACSASETAKAPRVSPNTVSSTNANETERSLDGQNKKEKSKLPDSQKEKVIRQAIKPDVISLKEYRAYQRRIAAERKAVQQARNCKRKFFKEIRKRKGTSHYAWELGSSNYFQYRGLKIRFYMRNSCGTNIYGEMYRIPKNENEKEALEEMIRDYGNPRSEISMGIRMRAHHHRKSLGYRPEPYELRYNRSIMPDELRYGYLYHEFNFAGTQDQVIDDIFDMANRIAYVMKNAQ